jgi:4-hydroxybenzoate polyprenyltransferase
VPCGPTRIGRAHRVVALASASHPGPTVAVTTVAVLLGVSAQLAGSQLLVVAATVLVGQLSIGWSNDWLDAGRDASAGRTDKPAADGAVSVMAVRRAAWVAGVLVVPLSLAVGWVGTWHLVLVASGWAYNLGLKGTPWSPAPYAVGFAALPVYVEAVAGTPASWWLATSGGLLGAAAHFANAAPDVAQDRQLGVLGMPQRIGARRSLVVALALLALVGGLLLTRIDTDGAQLAAAALVVALPVLGGTGLVVANRIGRPAFILVMVAAVVDVALLVVAS